MCQRKPAKYVLAKTKQKMTFTEMKNLSVVYQTLKGAKKLEDYNLEENKDNPSSVSLTKLLESKTSKNIMKVYRKIRLSE